MITRLIQRLLLVTGLLIGLTYAQSFRPTNNIPVKNPQGEYLPYAWSGGMNNPQFSDIDMDRDGQKDMVFFDRFDKTFTVFLNEGTPGTIDYQFDPSFSAHFDSCNCIEWALLVDYNCDGLEDVFCGGPSRQNIQLYEQVIYPGDSVGFELAYQPIDVLSSNVRPVYNTPTDIPAIVDVDGDGDVDIISTQTGSNFFALHTNLAMEGHGRCDTLDFILDTGCWGHFYEGSLDNNIVVADTQFCKRGEGEDPGVGLRHVGSTLLVEDFDGNGLKDAMLGDVSYATVNVVYNNGEPSHAFMDSVVYSYPTYDLAIYQVLFPGIFYEDVNNDGVRDLLVAPNASTGAENVEPTLLYLNEGRDDSLELRYWGHGIFARGSIDAGQGAHPAFFDHNGDGLQDMIVGSLNSVLRSADTTILTFQLQLYENTGTLQDPEFTLIDDDYLNASTLFPPLQAASPVAADLDGDGDDDLLVGQTNGQIRYFENAGAPNQSAVFVQITSALKDNLNQTIDVGVLSAPELYDIDGDNDLDLFIGNEFGAIVYYENVGSASAPVFTAVQDTFGGILAQNTFGDPFRGRAKPRFFDIDQDNQVELVVGEESGKIMIYDNPAAALTSSITSSGALFGQDFGEHSAPAITNLDDSGEPFFIIGTARGGLQLWNNRPESTNPSSLFKPAPVASLKLFPNPANQSVRIKWPGQASKPATLLILNMLGQVVTSRSVTGKEINLEVQDFPAGMYVLLIEQEGQRWSGRFVKE